jgi:hypothetical protein
VLITGAFDRLSNALAVECHRLLESNTSTRRPSFRADDSFHHSTIVPARLSFGDIWIVRPRPR